MQWHFYECHFLRRRNRMLDILPSAIHRTARGLGNFSSDDGSDNEDPSKQPILWRAEDEVYLDDALVYTMSEPLHWQVNCFIDWLPL
jgi:hypothetical protein